MNRILIKAREVLQEHGWIQGSLYDSRGYCLQGALDRAQLECYNLGYAEIRKQRAEAEAMLVKAIAERGGTRYIHNPDSIITWNDTVCQSADEAIEILKFASELAELRNELQRF